MFRDWLRFTLLVAVCMAVPLFALALPAGEPIEALAGMSTPDRGAPSSVAVQSSAVYPPTLAQPAADPSADPDLLTIARLVLEAARGRNWALVGALVLSLLIALVRRFAGRIAVSFAGRVVGRAAAWLTTDRGGALLALLAGVAAALAAAFGAGGGVSVQTVLDGLVAGVTAAGGYAVLRKLLFPSGADRAQQVVAVATAVGEAASAGPEAAADQINRSIGR